MRRRKESNSWVCECGNWYKYPAGIQIVPRCLKCGNRMVPDWPPNRVSRKILAYQGKTLWEKQANDAMREAAREAAILKKEKEKAKRKKISKLEEAIKFLANRYGEYNKVRKQVAESVVLIAKEICRNSDIGDAVTVGEKTFVHIIFGKGKENAEVIATTRGEEDGIATFHLFKKIVPNELGRIFCISGQWKTYYTNADIEDYLFFANNAAEIIEAFAELHKGRVG